MRLVTDALPALIAYFDTEQRLQFVKRTSRRHAPNVSSWPGTESCRSEKAPLASFSGFRCSTDTLYCAGRFVLSISAAIFHAPSTLFQTTMYLPSSSKRPSSVSKANVYQP